MMHREARGAGGAEREGFEVLMNLCGAQCAIMIRPQQMNRPVQVNTQLTSHGVDKQGISPWEETQILVCSASLLWGDRDYSFRMLLAHACANEQT
jgi:hypothetical protein